MQADYSRFSGWTDDGRALHSLGTALALEPGALSFPAPCLKKCSNQMPPAPALGNDMATHPPGNGTTPPIQGNNTVPPLPQLCFQCRLDETITERVSELDLSQLVLLGVVPLSKLRLVPEISGLQGLKVLRASGLPIQGELLAVECVLL
jgi:hypothetical protein